MLKTLLTGSVIHSNGDRSQEVGRRRIRRAAMGGPGEIAESTGVSTETAAETTHALVFQLLCADAEPGQ